MLYPLNLQKSVFSCLTCLPEFDIISQTNLPWEAELRESGMMNHHHSAYKKTVRVYFE